MKQTINSLGVLSVAKISALVYGVMGLIFLPICLAFAVAASMAGKADLGIGAPLLFVCAILAPLFYAGMGFVVGALSALIYNLCARWIGGIEIDLRPMAGAAVAGQNP